MTGWGGLICCAWLILTLLAWAVCSAIVKYMQSPEYKAWKQEEEARKQAAAIQADKNAARQHLANFYDTHKELLASVVPAADAYIRSEMPDTLEPVQLWTICHKRIAELQPLIAQQAEAAARDRAYPAKAVNLHADHQCRLATVHALGITDDVMTQLLEAEHTRYRNALMALTEQES